MIQPTVYFAVDEDGVEGEYYGKPPMRCTNYDHWYPDPLGRGYDYVEDGPLECNGTKQQ